MAQGANKSCEGCGGPITAEQIINRQAGLVSGVLLCPQCVERKRRELIEARNAALRGQDAAAQHSHLVSTAAPASGLERLAEPEEAEEIGSSQGAVWIPPITKAPDVADQTLSMVSDEEMSPAGSAQIRSFAEGSTLAGAHRESGFQRPLVGPEQGATRVRTFHGKLTEAGLAHMDEQINDWLDAHPDIFIKTSASSVGVFEGKTKEPHMLVSLFY